MSDKKRLLDLIPEEYQAEIRKEVLEEVYGKKKEEQAEMDAMIKAWAKEENEINKQMNPRR